MNADPKEIKDAETIASLSYREVIEMAYYGAQVIHPKTIKPLQNKNIPLHVKSFLNLNVEGTLISSKSTHHLPPIIVYKRKQILISLETKDFSFAEGNPVNALHEILYKLNIKANLSQNAAISLLLCVDDIAEKIQNLAVMADDMFNVQMEKDLTLLTIRHYTDEYLDRLTKNKTIVLEQKTVNTIQLLIREHPNQ